MTTPTRTGRTNTKAGMVVLRWARKGSSSASSAPRLAKVATMPSAVRWYVALGTSPLGLTCVTAFPSFGASLECTDAVAGSDETW